MTDGSEDGAGRQPPRSSDLTRRLTLEALRREVTEKHEALASELRGQVQALTDELEKLKSDRDQAPLPAWWLDLEPDERATRWADLAEWVSDVLPLLHPTLTETETLPPCWPEHPPAVWALSTAWWSWGHSVRGKGRKPTDPAGWLREVPVVEKALGRVFDQAGCREHPGYRRGEGMPRWMAS